MTHALRFELFYFSVCLFVYSIQNGSYKKESIHSRAGTTVGAGTVQKEAISAVFSGTKVCDDLK